MLPPNFARALAKGTVMSCFFFFLIRRTANVKSGRPTAYNYWFTKPQQNIGWFSRTWLVVTFSTCFLCRARCSWLWRFQPVFSVELGAVPTFSFHMNQIIDWSIVLSKCKRVKSSLLLRVKNVSHKKSEFHSNKSEISPILLFQEWKFHPF